MARRSTPTPSRVDGYLDDMGEHHTEIELALGEIAAQVDQAAAARNATIVRVAQLRSNEGEERITGLVADVSRLTDALHRIEEALHVGRVSVGQARVAAHELRSTPAIRRVRQQVRKGNEERRTRERRQAREVVTQHLVAI